MTPAHPSHSHPVVTNATGAIPVPMGALLLVCIVLATAAGCGPEGAPRMIVESRPSQSIEGVWRVTEQMTAPGCDGGGGLHEGVAIIEQTEGSTAITADSGAGVLHGTFQGDQASWTGGMGSGDGTFRTVTWLEVKVDGDTFAGASTWVIRDGFAGPEICSGESSVTGERAAPLSPAAPSGLRVTFDGATANLSWRDESDDETRFVVHFSDLSLLGGSGEIRVGANEASASVTPVNDGSVYAFWVSAENAGGSSSTLIEYAVPGAAPSSPPVSPSRLLARSGFPAAVEISWRDEATDETSYRVYRSTVSSHIGEVVASLPPGSIRYLDGPHAVEQSYYYRVVAVNAAGESSLAGPVEGVSERHLAGLWDVAGSVTVESPTTVDDCPPFEDDIDEAALATRVDLNRFDVRSRSFALSVFLDGSGRADATGTVFGPFWSVVRDASGFRFAGDPIGMAADLVVTSGVCTARLRLKLDAAPVPIVPGDLHVRSKSPHSVTLEWVDRADTETGVEVSRSEGGTGTARISRIGPMQVVARLGTGATAWTDYGVEPDTEYLYFVRSFNSTGFSPYADLLVSTPVQGVDPPESAPYDVRAEALSSTTVEVTWSEDSADEDGFEILRGVEVDDLALIARVGRDITAYVDTHVSADSQYFYTVRAVNEGGQSDEGNVARVRTPLPVELDAPSPLRATVTASDSVFLQWTDNALNEDGYQIFMTPGNVCPFVMPWLRSVPADTESESIMGLAPGTYCFVVVAYAGGDLSPRSNPASVTLSVSGS